MRIIRCLYRQEQTSLLNEERSQMRGLFEIEHNCRTGFLRSDADYHKRDADVEYYCDLPSVTVDVLANGCDQDPEFYIGEEVWNHKPDHTTPTFETESHIIRLTGHKVS